MQKRFSLRTLEFCKGLKDQQKSVQMPSTLQNIKYKCQIVNSILKIALSQTFLSQQLSESSESIYYFPINKGICLESFEAKYNQNTIKGIIKQKSQAQKEYQENKEQGNLISYAETSTDEDQDYCKILLGNLPPNQQIEINLVFSQQLQSLFNKYFVAEIPIQSCNNQFSTELDSHFFKLDLFCTGKITYAKSLIHQVQQTQLDSNTIQFNMSQDQFKNSLCFKLVFSFKGMFDPQIIFGSSRIFNEDSVKMAILPVCNSIMVSFIPNFNEEKTNQIDQAIQVATDKGDDVFSGKFQEQINREMLDHFDSSRSEFIFLLDRSGSMSGSPIKKACEALILFLKSLPTDSYFNVVSFGSSSSSLFESSSKYDHSNLEKSIKSIKEYTANLGGTEIYQPLKRVFEQKRISGYNKQIFLLTDGEVDSPQQVVNMIKRNNKFNRVHSIGFGSGADKYLINESAKAGKGISKIVDLNCDLQEVILEMLSHSISPTFDEFKIVYDKNIFDSTYPSLTDFPCVFRDDIINIHLFFKPLVEIQNLTDEQKRIQIEYFDSHKKQKIKNEIKIEIQDCFQANLELQQSVFKIGKQLQLNEMIMMNQNKNEVVEQQAIDFQLLTSETALICIIESLNDEQKVIFSNIKCINSSKAKQLPESDEDDSYNVLLDINQIDQKYTNYYSRGLNQYQSACVAISPKLQEYAKNEETPEEDFGMGYLFGGFSYQESNQNPSTNTQKDSKSQIINKKSLNEDYENCLQGDLFEMNYQENNNEIIQKNAKLNSNLELQDLLNLVDFEGVWKYDEILLQKLINKMDSTQIQQYSPCFMTKDAFMTLVVTILLELKFSSQKTKWVLISKKSTTFIKSQLKQTVDLNSLSENIKLLISF